MRSGDRLLLIDEHDKQAPVRLCDKSLDLGHARLHQVVSMSLVAAKLSGWRSCTSQVLIALT